MASAKTREDVRHKRAVQGAMSIGTATIGLTALGSKGASMALRKYPKALRSMKFVPKKINADSLNSTSISLTTAGAGLGGASGYHFAALQRAENKAQKENEKSAFGVTHKKS